LLCDNLPILGFRVSLFGSVGNHVQLTRPFEVSSAATVQMIGFLLFERYEYFVSSVFSALGHHPRSCTGFDKQGEQWLPPTNLNVHVYPIV